MGLRTSISFTGEMAKKIHLWFMILTLSKNGNWLSWPTGDRLIESLSNQSQLTDNSNLLFCPNHQVLPPIIRRHLRDIQASVATDGHGNDTERVIFSICTTSLPKNIESDSETKLDHSCQKSSDWLDAWHRLTAKAATVSAPPMLMFTLPVFALRYVCIVGKTKHNVTDHVCQIAKLIKRIVPCIKVLTLQRRYN